MEPLRFYTAAEVADLLRLNHQVVQRKLQAGEIPGYRLGREWRVEHGQLLAWLEQHSNRVDKGPEAWFGPDGRLRSLPAQRSKRLPVLRRIGRGLEAGRTYTERELNAELASVHEDVATLRREMVAERVLFRSPDGVYKLAGARQPALRRA
ncbi:MAG TPA: DUF2087 domain-containing protein [Acidimicrobiales bacterium]|nr:DUF2087 domain-containing protein [Acidimicrobiales bacterium]